MNASVPRGKQPIIFCDFDGTITLSDNIVAIMKHFNPPGWEPIVEDIVSGRKSIRQGVGEMFALFPSDRKEEMITYVLETAGIRPGFGELLQLCKEKEIPFYVTSGGIDFFLKPLLAPFHIPEDHVYCNSADFSGETIEILWPHPCDDICHNNCGMCKTRVIRGFDPQTHYRILIGDSITDFEGAKLADLIFARSHLAARCRVLNLPFYEYDTFHDVIDVLQTLTATVQEESH
jgi:2-hydroxy-3-keto-5-methylthiopentenyl-1-phosphate phosphatase